MKTLTYDNPASMQRECWQDGRLLCAYAAELFPPFAKKQTIPGRLLFFGANVGEWKTGQALGDMAAMRKAA